MEKLGLIVDSLQIQEIEDPTGYIKNLGAPARRRRGQPGPHRPGRRRPEATEREQEAEALKAEARRTAEIKQAGYQAEIDQAAASARQAGPLSEATARQEVVVEETKVAELEAQREEQRLQATVRKPADAQAYQQITLAKAERDARIAAAEAGARRSSCTPPADAARISQVGTAEAAANPARGEAEGDAIRARGMAEAEAIAKRADALARSPRPSSASRSPRSPAIVEAAAKPFANVDQLTVLNGAQGLTEIMNQLVSQGASVYKVARELVATEEPSPNGKVTLP